MVPAFPYGPALVSKVQKNPTSIAASGKNRKCGHAHGDNMAVYGKCDVVFSENKNSTYNEKNLGDSSHQVLTNFRFLEFLTSDLQKSFDFFFHLLQSDSTNETATYIYLCTNVKDIVGIGTPSGKTKCTVALL
jgi:hypothetical protein